MIHRRELANPSLRRPRVAVAVLCVLAVTFPLVLMVRSRWPYSRRAVESSLQQAFSARVEIGKFRSTYSPHPGCVAEDITLRFEHSDSAPLRIKQLTLQSGWLGLLRKRIDQVRAVGLYLHSAR